MTCSFSLGLVGLMMVSHVLAGATTIDFESLSDSDPTNQFPGLTFSNTIVLTAGITLNEFEFPPKSGVNVVSDEGGPITIAFAPLVIDFTGQVVFVTAMSGFFSYAVPLTLTAFGL